MTYKDIDRYKRLYYFFYHAYYVSNNTRDPYYLIVTSAGFFVYRIYKLQDLSVYSKPYKTPAQLYQHLIDKGLSFTPPYRWNQAEEVLSRINYYRFKAYLFPYLNQETKSYREGTAFKDGVALYEFDSELRELCNRFILKIEVKIRSKLDQVVSKNTGDPFWYLNNDNFYPDKIPDYHRGKIRTEMNRSKAEFAKHYRGKYQSPNDTYPSLPPFWVAAELITFGGFLDILSGVNKSKIGPQRNNPLDKMSKNFGAKNFIELKSWLPLIKEIRNRCSHSSRTWNSNYRLPAGFVDDSNQVITSRMTVPPTNKNKLYLGLVIIHLMSKGNMLNNHDFKSDLDELLTKYSHIDSLEYWIGIPSAWKNEPIWQ